MMEFIKDSRITIKKAGVTQATVTSAYIESLTTIKETDISANYTPCGECTAIIDESAPNISILLSLSASDYDNLIAVVEVLWSDRQSFDVYGTYYIDSILPDIENHSITVHAYDILYRLGTSKFGGIAVQSVSTSLETYADVVAATAGIDNCAFDASMGNTTGYILKSTHREALRQIAEAGAAALYVGDDGIVTFGEPVRDILTIPDIEIGYGDIVENSVNTSIKSVDRPVTVKVYTYGSPHAEQSLSKQIDFLIKAGQTINVEVDFDEYPAHITRCETSPAASTDITITYYNQYPDHAIITMRNNTAQAKSGLLTVIGRVYAVTTEEVNQGTPSAKNEYVEIDNPLIMTSNDAYFVAWINHNLIYGNPRHGMELFGVRVGLLDVIDVAGDYYLTVDRIVTKITGGDYKITVEGYEYHPETVSLNAPEE